MFREQGLLLCDERSWLVPQSSEMYGFAPSPCCGRHLTAYNALCRGCSERRALLQIRRPRIGRCVLAFADGLHTESSSRSGRQ